MIDIDALKESKQYVIHDIAGTGEKVVNKIKKESNGYPIKSIEDIYRIRSYLLAHHRYRDNMLFTLGISLGIRATDLQTLKLSDFIENDSHFKSYYLAYDSIAGRTRRHRFVPIDDVIMDAIILFLENNEYNDNFDLDDFLFISNSNHGRMKKEPLSRNSIKRILETISKEVGLNQIITTASLRKTYCYHRIVNSHYNEGVLAETQRMLDCDSTVEMLIYIGFSAEEILQYIQMQSESEQ